MQKIPIWSSGKIILFYYHRAVIISILQFQLLQGENNSFRKLFRVKAE